MKRKGGVGSILQMAYTYLYIETYGVARACVPRPYDHVLLAAILYLPCFTGGG
jgi:hypothetical protein